MDEKQAQLVMEWFSEDGWYAAQRLIRMAYYIKNTFDTYPNELALDGYEALEKTMGRVSYSKWDEIMSRGEHAMRVDFQRGYTHLNIDELEFHPYDDDARKVMVGAMN